MSFWHHLINLKCVLCVLSCKWWLMISLVIAKWDGQAYQYNAHSSAVSWSLLLQVLRRTDLLMLNQIYTVKCVKCRYLDKALKWQLQAFAKIYQQMQLPALPYQNLNNSLQICMCAVCTRARSTYKTLLPTLLHALSGVHEAGCWLQFYTNDQRWKSIFVAADVVRFCPGWSDETRDSQNASVPF